MSKDKDNKDEKPSKSVVWEPPEKIDPPPDHEDDDDDSFHVTASDVDIPPLESDDKSSTASTTSSGSDQKQQQQQQQRKPNKPSSEMSMILPCLFVGSLEDAKNEEQMVKNKISSVISVYKDAKALVSSRTFMCVDAIDNSLQDIRQYISSVNDFIHENRKKGNVLIHCTTGTNCSIALVIAYVMTVTDLTYNKSFNFVQRRRLVAHPNVGFTRKLRKFEGETLAQEKARFRLKYPKETDSFDDRKEYENNQDKNKPKSGS